MKIILLKHNLKLLIIKINIHNELMIILNQILDYFWINLKVFD